MSSNITYNLQIDSKFRDIEKYPNPCDFGVTFINSATGSNVLGQPVNNQQFYSPVQIDPDYLDSNFKIQNAEIFTYNKVNNYIYLSGVMNLQSSSDMFKIEYLPQPSLQLPNTLVNYTGYSIVSLTGISILENPFLAVIYQDQNSIYNLSWINYLTINTGSPSDVTNNSTRSTSRFSPSQNDVIFWCFDFSTSVNITQFNNLTYQTIYQIPEPANGNTALLISGYNISDGSTYKYEAREWGYELITSDYSIEKTKDNGRFNINLDDTNNVYVSGNVSNLNPSYDYLKVPLPTGAGFGNYDNDQSQLLYYITGSSGGVSYVSIFPFNIENSIGIGSTGNSYVLFTKVNEDNSLQYLGQYRIEKDPGGIYQQIGFCRYGVKRVGNKAYLATAITDSSRTMNSYESRIYELNPTGATGSVVCYFGSGPSVTYFPAGLYSTVVNTDLYSIMRCGINTGTFKSDKLLIHKFDTLTNIGTTVCFTGIQGLPTGQNGYPAMGGGLTPGTQEDISAQVIGTDIYIYLGNLVANLGKQGLVMPLFVLKWDTVTNILTNYGQKALNPIWSRFGGYFTYASGQKLLINRGNSTDLNTYLYDVTDPINIKFVYQLPLVPLLRQITEINGIFYAGVVNYTKLNIYNFSDPYNPKFVSSSEPLADGKFETTESVDHKTSLLGYGGDDVNGFYLYRTQPVISNNMTVNFTNITQNKGQTVQTIDEFLFQTSYIPKNFSSPFYTNFKKKMFLFYANTRSLCVDDISNINNTIVRKTVSLTPFNFTNIINRPVGLYGTRWNMHLFDTEDGIYILFGFYNKLGLYKYEDNNTLTPTLIELYQESVSSVLGGIVYVSSYFYNTDHFAIFVFVNNVIKIYKIVNGSSLQLVTTTSPAAGSFVATCGAILVYHTLQNQYFLHIIGNGNFITNNTPRKLNGINITNPYLPIQTPAVNAYSFPTNLFTTSDGISFQEDENLNVALYVSGQTRFSIIDITVPTNYNFLAAPARNSNQASYLQNIVSYYNSVNKRRYLLQQYWGNRLYPNNYIIFDITNIFSPETIGDKILLPNNVNNQMIVHLTMAQNESKSYCSFLIPNYFYSTGASGAYATGSPANGTTGATGPDIKNNYLYYLYDLSNIEFANNNQNVKYESVSYPLLPNNGSSFISKLNADGTVGWFSYIGSHPDDDGQFINISNFSLDKSKKFIYLSGGWQNSIAFYQSSSSIFSASGIFNYFKSQNTVYNSFVSKLNIFTGQWIWSLPLIGNLDDFTERLNYQNYANNELLLMSMHFNSFSLNTYQAINSSYNPSSILTNIINITNNTSSVSSVLYAFTNIGSVSWNILFFSKIPLTNVYIKNVDSSDGIITCIGIADTPELSCQDASGNEVQTTYSNTQAIIQKYIFIYRFTYLGIYISSQRIEFPLSNSYLNINDIKTYVNSNNFLLPITFTNLQQDNIDLFNKDGSYASSVSQYSPIIQNTILTSYQNNSQYTDINNKVYTRIKHLYPAGLNTGAGFYTNYYDYIIGYTGDSILNNSFSIRNSFQDNSSFNTVLNQYIDTSKIKRVFYNYGNTGQFIRPDLNFYRLNLCKTPQNGFVIYDSIDASNGIIFLSGKHFNNGNNLFITISSGTNIPVTYVSNYSGSNDVLTYNPQEYSIPTGDKPFLIVNNKNLSAYYTYQFYPGSLFKSNYFIIKKLTMTIPNRLIRNSVYSGLRDLNDLPYLYLKIFNEDQIQTVDINNFNLVYDNNVNTGTNACFQFPISYAGTTSNFTTLSLDIQPRIKFSYNFYTFRFQLLDPEGEVIIFDPTPYKSSDQIFTGQIPANLLNITVRMQISLSN